MNPKSPEFKALQQSWYRKLKSKGFNDIEQSEYELKSWASWYYVEDYTKDVHDAHERYYQLASQLLHTYKFKDKREKKVWELHTKGKYPSEIARLVGYKDKKSVYNIIHKIDRVFKKV